MTFENSPSIEEYSSNKAPQESRFHAYRNVGKTRKDVCGYLKIVKADDCPEGYVTEKCGGDNECVSDRSKCMFKKEVFSILKGNVEPDLDEIEKMIEKYETSKNTRESKQDNNYECLNEKIVINGKELKLYWSEENSTKTRTKGTIALKIGEKEYIFILSYNTVIYNGRDIKKNIKITKYFTVSGGQKKLTKEFNKPIGKIKTRHGRLKTYEDLIGESIFNKILN